MKTCSVEECERVVQARGWCDPHYKRWWRYGTTEARGVFPEPLADPVAHFYERVEKGEHWIWQGSHFPSGYGQVHVNRRPMHAHRRAWVLVAGEIPEGKKALHTCDIRDCVRNDDEGWYEVDGILLPRRGHLFLGTHLDNMKDMAAKGRRVNVPHYGDANGNSRAARLLRSSKER